MSIGHLEFESPPLSYEPGREIDLQIRLAEGQYSFNQIYGKALWGEVEEKMIFHQTVDQSLYIAKYAPKEAGTHKFITDPNQDYIINPPIRTVELEIYQFPVWITVSIMSGGIGIGGIVLFLFIFLRKRPTRNESEDGETEDKIEIDPRAEIAELHNIIVKPHPFCDVSSFIQLYLDNIKFELTNDSLESLWSKVGIVYVSNMTSSGIESLIMGLPTIIYLDHNMINLSPAIDCEGVMFASSPQDFINYLESPITPTPRNDYLYLDQRLTRWKKLLASDYN